MHRPVYNCEVGGDVGENREREPARSGAQETESDTEIHGETGKSHTKIGGLDGEQMTDAENES